MQRIFLTTLLFFVCASSVFAQQQRITLEDAIRISLENNFQLKQAENNVRSSEISIRGELADFLPTLSGSLGGSISEGQQFIAEIFEFGNFTSKNINGSLSTSIPIFAGFNNILTLRNAEATKLSREETLRRAKESVIFNTASRFLQVILDTELLKISRETLETSRRQLEQVKAQVEVGSRPSVDLFNQEAQVANNELDVTNRENALNLSRILLIRQMQIDPLAQYDFVIPDIDQIGLNASANDYDIASLVAAALKNRADIKSEEYTIKALGYQVKATKGSYLPRLTASASLSSSYSDQSRDPVTRSGVSFSDQFFDRQVRKTASLNLQIPIFSNLNTRTSVQTQKIQYKNAVLGLENTKLQVVQEVNQAHNDLISFTKQLEASQKSVEATRRAFETQQERYNVGASTLIELSQATTDYRSAQSTFTRAVYNFIFQEKLLDFFLGKLDEGITIE